MTRATCHMSISVDGFVGAGERLFDGVEDPGLEPVAGVHSPHATHITYRVGR
jgi:hypothetical protein